MHDHQSVLQKLGISSNPSGVGVGGRWMAARGEPLKVRSPIDGRTLATIQSASDADVQSAIDAASEAFKRWRLVPAPHRGEFVRRLGEKLRQRKARRNPPDSGNMINEAIELEALGLMFSASRLMEHARQLGRRPAPPRAIGRRPALARKQCREVSRCGQTSVADLS